MTEQSARHYVYVFRNVGGVPLYVGRGVGSRWSRHFDAAWLANMESIKIEVRFVADKKAAQKLEAKLIKEYGRRSDGTGTLHNDRRNIQFGLSEEIVSLRQAGWSLAEIGKHLRISRDMVSVVAKAEGVGGRSFGGGSRSYDIRNQFGLFEVRSPEG